MSSPSFSVQPDMSTTATTAAAAKRPDRDWTVHNAEDDEMRFTGLHSKSDIPSRSFKHLLGGSLDAGTDQSGGLVFWK